MSTQSSPPPIRSLAPLLVVKDISRSVDFYSNKLDFTVTEQWSPDGDLKWCRLERGNSAIMLQQACDEDGPSEGRGRGVIFYFNCDDANAEHERLAALGVDIDPPKVAFYGMNQLYLHDPDDYQLCFQNCTAEE